jgi:hypothetical protein
MSEFNIKNSKIEQLNTSGNNYKVTAAGNVAVTEKGGTVQTVGTGNKVHVDHKPGILSLLWQRVKSCWKWFIGLFGGAGA